MIVTCKRKEDSKAVQWNGGNIREMRDFLGNWFDEIMGHVSKDDYVVINPYSIAPMVVSKEEFEDTYEIID